MVIGLAIDPQICDHYNGIIYVAPCLRWLPWPATIPKKVWKCPDCGYSEMWYKNEKVE